jgi:UDP-3-O-[3-hydroxymyristoyl] glucosamine N-acyltransferase
MEFTVNQIAAIVAGQVEGDGDLKINQLAKIEEGKAGAISFLSNLKYEPYLYTTDSSVVIIDEGFEPKQPLKTTLIRVKDAYTGFTTLLEQYQQIVKNTLNGIEQPSYIGTDTQHGDGFYLGAFAYVGSGVKIRKNVKIHPQAFVGNNVEIGDNCHIHSGVKIYANTIIGNNCNIFANAVIGCDGFGFAPQPDGSYRTIPQLGNVVLEDNVSVGANSTIDCATMGSTIIRKGVKIDNLVQIAHNVEIGENTVIASQTGISGSTKIGKNCVVAGQVGFAGHITVADNTKIGGQAGVTSSVIAAGQSLFGTPAVGVKESLRSSVVLKRLPQLEKRIHELEKKVINQK